MVHVVFKRIDDWKENLIDVDDDMVLYMQGMGDFLNEMASIMRSQTNKRNVSILLPSFLPMCVEEDVGRRSN